MLNSFTNQRGISIFIAMGFIGALFLVTLGVSNVIISFLKSSRNIEIMNSSYFAAEGAQEDAFYDLGEHLSGYEHHFDSSVNNDESSQDSSLQSSWDISSLIPYNNDSGYFQIPPQDEGNSPINKDWNKLSIGESVTVDLYIDQSTFGNQSTDADLLNISDNNFQFNELIIKMRAASGATLKTDEEEENSIADDTIVTWSLSGVDKTIPDKFYIVRENNDVYEKDDSSGQIVVSRRYDLSSEIYESRLNSLGTDINDYIIIDSESSGGYGANEIIFEGLNEAGEGNISTIKDFLINTDIIRPTLKLSLISQLTDIDGNLVPFIEYQIILDSETPIPNKHFTVTAQASVNGFKQTIRSKVSKAGGISLLDFAVFQ